MPAGPHEPESSLQVTCYSRPKRVAYLVNPETVTDRELNLIVRSCCRSWGGRFSPIIPTDGSAIQPGWWDLLVAADPDILYCLLELAPELVARLARSIDPARIFECSSADLDSQHSFRIHEDEIASIGIEAIPRFTTARAAIVPGTTVLYIKDSYRQDTPVLTFILRNFGVLPRETYMESAFGGTTYDTCDTEQVTLAAFLAAIAPPHPSSRTPLDLAGYYAEPPHLAPTPASDHFTIVLGDKPIDYIHAWNRSLIRHGRGDRGWLWLPTWLLADTESMSALGTCLNREIDAQHQTPSVASCSLDETSVADVAETMGKVTRYPFVPETLAPSAFPCTRQLPSRRLDLPSVTEQVAFYEDRGICAIPRPQFLVPHLPHFGVPGLTKEGWMVEVQLQYHPARYQHTNVRPHWQLPRKPGLARLFFGDDHGAARISSSGLPCTEVTAHAQALHLRVPSDHAIVDTWFHSAFLHSNRQHRTAAPRYSDFVISAEGRRLQGMLDLLAKTPASGVPVTGVGCYLCGSARSATGAGLPS